MPTGNFENLNFNRILSDATCFTDRSGIFEDNREAIDVYLRIQALKAAGGADYTSTTGSGMAGLLAAAASWISPVLVLQCDTRQAVNVQLDLQNAITDGATFASDINSLKAASAQALGLPKNTRRNLLLYLKAAVNAQGKPE